MGVPESVRLPSVAMTEGRRLQRIGRTAKDPVKLRRAIVVLMSAQAKAPPISRTCWIVRWSTCVG